MTETVFYLSSHIRFGSARSTPHSPGTNINLGLVSSRTR